jgi:site-specific DNA-methyltransferase (adenine-specific)
MDARVSGAAFARDARNRGDGLKLLRSIHAAEAALVILDPQYRSVLDALAFGNEGARQKERAKLPPMSEHLIAIFVEQAERILRPSGHLFLWADKFMIGEGRHLAYLRYTRLQIVDLLCWDKGRIGMGRRSRCRAEFLVVAQKAPIKAAGCWRDHSIEDVWLELQERRRHAHAKPVRLLERLICAVTKPGELVVDPCAGGWGVLEICRAAGRRFLGADLLG